MQDNLADMMGVKAVDVANPPGLIFTFYVRYTKFNKIPKQRYQKLERQYLMYVHFHVTHA